MNDDTIVDGLRHCWLDSRRRDRKTGSPDYPHRRRFMCTTSAQSMFGAGWKLRGREQLLLQRFEYSRTHRESQGQGETRKGPVRRQGGKGPPR